MNRDRLAALCGVAAPTVAIGSILLATVIASTETFTWRDRALSHMGEAGTETFVLFNGGLVVAGLVGIPFGWLLWREARNRLERLGVGLLAAAVVGLVGVGVFFIGHDSYYLPVDLHAPAALVVFLGAPVAALLHAAGLRREGDGTAARITALLGVSHFITWIVWVAAVGGSESMPWFAVPEMVAALLFAAWIYYLAIPRLAGGDAAAPGRSTPTQRLS